MEAKEKKERKDRVPSSPGLRKRKKGERVCLSGYKKMRLGGEGGKRKKESTAGFIFQTGKKEKKKEKKRE